MTKKRKKPLSKQAKTTITFIICIFLVGAILGGIITGAIKDTAVDKKPMYGSRDGNSIAEDGELIVLKNNEADFIPIDCELPYELQEYTYYLCQAYYIDFDFVMALMFTESSFNATAVSATNDYGLMQINACNHKQLEDKLGITDIMEPYQNIRAGLYMLRGLFEKYDDASKVCMAYSLGEYGASVLWDKGIYSTSYSNKILIKADEYKTQQLKNEK